MILSALLPLVAQASAPATLEQTKLAICLEQARADPTTAIMTASVWIGEAYAAERAFPLQCIGIAYTRLLRWDAAERSFLAGRDDALEQDFPLRAKLAAMAGNAALADERYDAALADLALAAADAAAGGETVVGGEVEIDRSRALVALGRMDEAGEALAKARSDAPQDVDTWLLSATLARRLDDLAKAQAYIETAAGLDPRNPAVGLEAGLIAVLSGDDDAARKSWQSVVDISPDSPEAETAKTYLAQLAGDAG